MAGALRTAIGEALDPDGRARRGVVMVIVLSILLILAMIGVVFVTFEMLEKRVARNFTDDVRSKMLAQSGIDHAVAELDRIFSTNAGFQYTTVGGLSSAGQDTTFVYYGSQADETQVPVADTPLVQAVNPSFAIEVDDDPSNGPSNAAPKTATVEGVPRGLSGVSSTGTYAINGDVYALKITDESGKININDGVQWGPTHSVSRNLERLLNHLGNQMSPPVATLGTTLLNNRPPWSASLPVGAIQGYKAPYEVLAALGNDNALWERVMSFVTLYSWKDKNVANPVPLSAWAVANGYYPASITYTRPTYPAGVGGPTGLPIYRHGHQFNYKRTAIAADLQFYQTSMQAGYANGIYGHDSLLPYWIEIVERSPINLNTSPHEVLSAALIDLQGFFSAVERRRDRPVSAPSSSSYTWMSTAYTYDSTGTASTGGGDGDEAGFLYTTMKYVDASAGSVVEGQLSAQIVADEIIACRQRAANCGTVHAANGTAFAHPVIDYSSTGALPFRGPFRTWAQFNAFVDHLVGEGVLYDDRGGTTNSWFFDYNQSGTIKSGLSKVQNWMAAQAAGDVLKANFNPNLHLNELNPDRSIWTYVDKTDLLVNSTEGCFVDGNGAYTIESLGMVLQPDVGQDIYLAADNQVVAQRKAVAIVKLMGEAVRVTHQADFYGPSTAYADRKGVDETSNNYSVEVGPEPDNGPIKDTPPAPGAQDMRRARWDGYVALPTYGGEYHTLGVHKSPNTFVSRLDPAEDSDYGQFYDANTNVTSPYKNEAIHNHFTYDANCHYHADRANTSFSDAIGEPQGQVRFFFGNLPAPYPPAGNGVQSFDQAMDVLLGVAATPWRITEFQAFEDRYETTAGYLGIYSPNRTWPTSGGPNRYRLAKSFTPAAGSPPPAFPWNTASGYQPLAPPSDVRIDGHYMERSSVPAYIIHDLEAWYQSNSSTYVNNSSWRFSEGTTSFWMKPNWFPESTGKIRKLLSFSRYRQHACVYYQSGMGPGTGLVYTDTTYANGAGGHPANERECNCANAWVEKVNPQPFALYYLPAHVSAPGGPPTYDGDMSTQIGYVGGVGKFRPSSFGFGMAGGADSGLNWLVKLGTHPTQAANPADATMSNPANRGNLAAYVVTPPLNHESHVNDPKELLDPLRGAEAGAPLNWLRAHEWLHVTVSWKMPKSPTPSDVYNFQIFLNGTIVPGSTGVVDSDSAHPGTSGYTPSTYTNWWLMGYEGACGGCGVNHGAWHWGQNGIRLGGEVDEIALNRGGAWSWDNATNPLPRLFTADATMDELFHWVYSGGPAGPGTGASNVNRPIHPDAAGLWDVGRYYHPLDTTNTDLTESTYTMPAGVIDLTPVGGGARDLPPATTTSAPPPDSEGGAGGIGTSLTTSAASGGTKLIGISWTVMAEAYNPPAYGALSTTDAMIPYLRNWNPPDNPGAIVQPAPGLPSMPAVNPAFSGVTLGDMYVLVGAVQLGPYRDEAFSALLDPATGKPFDVTAANLANIRPRFKFRIGVADPILLSSPVLDDLTLYYSQGGVRYLAFYYTL